MFDDTFHKVIHENSVVSVNGHFFPVAVVSSHGLWIRPSSFIRTTRVVDRDGMNGLKDLFIQLRMVHIRDDWIGLFFFFYAESLIFTVGVNILPIVIQHMLSHCFGCLALTLLWMPCATQTGRLLMVIWIA